MAHAKLVPPPWTPSWTVENKTLSAVEQAYNYILEGILSGALAPGMRVPSEAVAEALHISRMPVRASVVVRAISVSSSARSERLIALGTTAAPKQSRSMRLSRPGRLDLGQFRNH